MRFAPGKTDTEHALYFLDFGDDRVRWLNAVEVDVGGSVSITRYERKH